jgi:hypothetical protein
MATNNKKPTHTLRCGNIKADPAECQREGTVLRSDLLPTISRISPAPGATGLLSVLMTLRL